MKQTEGPDWLLFLLGDAGSQSANRVRVWRALKALGPAIVRDGVYLLPYRPELEPELNEQQVEVRRGGGQAYIFAIPSADDDAPRLRALFDRTAEFAALAQAARAFDSDDASEKNETEARRALRSLQREFATLASTDYFPNAGQSEAREALTAAEEAFVQRFSPGEPHPAQREIARLDRAEYQHRLWATRERLWVDRIASAWLIRRFIDPHATFRWFADVRDCPPDALGFDFDGAAFTHVGKAVTFEVLMHSFSLSDDCGLVRMAKMVRSLDIPGSPRSPEAAGFEALLTGAREQCVTDDDLLGALSPPMNFLYAAFSHNALDDRNGDAGDTETMET